MKMNCPSRVYILRDCLMQVRRELATEAPDLRKLQTMVSLALALVEPPDPDYVSLRAVNWDTTPSWKA